jgi:hypothetical protein
VTAATVVGSLRARPDTIRLAADGQPGLTIRAQLAEAWDTVRVEAGERDSVAAVKARVLDVLAPASGLPDDYLVKLSGVEILDEGVTLSAAGVVNGSTLFIAYRRRRAVR